MSVETLKIFEIVSANFPEAQAKAISNAINTAIEADTENNKEILAIKVDISTAKTEIITTILRWMFIFWIGQIAVTTGIIFAMLNLYFK